MEALGSLQKEHAGLQQQKEEKEFAWAKLAEELREKDEEDAEIKPAMEGLEAEAKEYHGKQKALELAKEELEEKSALLQEALDKKEAEVAESQTNIGSKLKGIASQDQKLSEIRALLAVREEELVETGGKAQEERRQGDLKKEARETRLKEVQQGKPARERSLGRKLESDLQPREEALRQLTARARERQDIAAILGRELQGVFLGPPVLRRTCRGRPTRTAAEEEEAAAG